MRLDNRHFFFIFIFLTALSFEILALPPQPEREKPKKDQETSYPKSKNATKTRMHVDKSKKVNPKLNIGPFGNMSLFLNPLFSQLHFLRPRLEEMPDSLGV